MANFQMGEDLTTYDIDSILSSLGSGPSVENTSNEALLQTFFTSDVLQTPSPESSPFQAFAATPTSDDHSSFNERSDSSGDELAGFEQVFKISLCSYIFPCRFLQILILISAWDQTKDRKTDSIQ